MYAYEERGLRVVLIGFDFTRSDLPFKVAFPVMMSNIFNWLNPHKLEFSILKARAGEAFDIYLNPQTNTIYTRAPYEKWEKHPVKTNPFRYENTGRVGIYTVAENGKEHYFTVNLADESESDTNTKPFEHLSDPSEPHLGSDEISAQQPLWMVFILLGCGLLMMEWLAWLRIKM
jgi:hypothetical protein